VAILTHRLFIGHDNEQAFFLREGGANLSTGQYDLLTRVRVDLVPQNGDGSVTTLDSLVTPDLFRWGGADGPRVVIEGAELANVTGLQPGTYRGRVTAYSATQPDGVVYADFPDYYLVIHPAIP